MIGKAVIMAGVALLLLLGCASDDKLEAPPPNRQPRDLMDFSIELTETTDTNIPFSSFSSQPLLIFYFSPYCPHCQATYSGVQQLANEYEQRGLAFIAIAIGGASKQDILQFIERYAPGAAIPFFMIQKMSSVKNMAMAMCQGFIWFFRIKNIFAIQMRIAKV